MPISKYAQEHAAELKVNLGRLAYLDEMLTKWTKENTTPTIATRVLRNGKEIFLGGYGIAGPHKPYGSMTTDMLFPVSSITKSVTATMMCILQEDGIIDLCDRLDQYFPNFVGEGKESVLLWQLLTHCSGITDESVKDFVKKEYPNLNLDDAKMREVYFEMSLKAPLAAKPKTKMTYCSIGYEYCAKIIQMITGKSLDEFGAERIFKPLGMDNTYWVVPENKWGNIVRRDNSYRGGEWLNCEQCFVRESGSGGLKTTVTDFTNFYDMIRNNGTFDGKRILSPATVREMTTNHNQGMTSIYHGSEQGSSWGFGFNVRGSKKDDTGILRSAFALDHGGFGGTRILTDREYGLTFAFFSVDIVKAQLLSAKFANIVYSALD